MPNEYLYYFYYRERAVANVLSSPQTRGELIEEINREMTSELASIDIENDFEKGLACFEKWYGMRENNYMAAETGIHRDKPWTLTCTAKMLADTQVSRSVSWILLALARRSR